MSRPKDEDNYEDINESQLDQTFVFDKFVQDLDHREQLRREALEKMPYDQAQANRVRDARNREHLHNRLRWSR